MLRPGPSYLQPRPRIPATGRPVAETRDQRVPGSGWGLVKDRATAPGRARVPVQIPVGWWEFPAAVPLAGFRRPVQRGAVALPHLLPGFRRQPRKGRSPGPRELPPPRRPRRGAWTWTSDFDLTQNALLDGYSRSAPGSQTSQRRKSRNLREAPPKLGRAEGADGAGQDPVYAAQRLGHADASVESMKAYAKALEGARGLSVRHPGGHLRRAGRM